MTEPFFLDVVRHTHGPLVCFQVIRQAGTKKRRHIVFATAWIHKSREVEISNQHLTLSVMVEAFNGRQRDRIEVALRRDRELDR